ncbi:MAG: type II secretion system F family protein [Oscillospiraceae bacterium]|nr:type II secretion system F family protein [Oscillospiraceae bacterium]
MGKQTLDSLGVSAFCESMGMMLHSGIQTDEAISLLQQNKKHGGVLEQGLAVMKQQIDEGSGMAEAMRESGIFPSYALQMVSAGESSGRLEDIFFRLSRYFADQKTISDKLRNAVTYPAAMLVMIIAVLAVILGMVLPSFTDVYDTLTGSLVSSSYRYVRWAYGFCYAALAVMVVLATALAVGLWMWNHGRRTVVEKALERIPLCRAILENLGMFRFTSAMATFIASGEMQDEAVLNSIPMTDCAAVEDKLRRCVEAMEKGRSFAQAAYDEELFEPVYGRMLLAGERSGSLESILGRLNGLLEENSGSLVDRLVGIVDPLLSGVLMVTVGFLLISVMLPLIGMMNSIG